MNFQFENKLPIVNVKALSTLWLEFEARIVKLLDPDPVGVPEITPVVAFKLRPPGRVPETTDQPIGVAPVAVRVTEYAVPVLPLNNGDVEVIANGAAGALIDKLMF